MSESQKTLPKSSGIYDNIAQIISELTSVEQIESQSDDEKDELFVSTNVSQEFLETDLNQGLSNEEISARIKRFGTNELSENIENLFVKFLMYFVGPIQFVMELAVALAGGLGLWIDFGVICAMLLLNACVGFFQEYKAGNIVSQLKTTMAPKALVIRNGITAEVDSTGIVPGDIVKLEEGSIIPADGTIVDDCLFLVDQSVLTGESMAIEKYHGNNVFSSSIVKRGTGRMIVTSIGDNTFLGRTAVLVNKTEKVGHFTAVITGIGKVLLLLMILFFLIIYISGFYRSVDIVTLLTQTLIITIVGVPVGLPAVVTTTMAVGAANLARKKAVVRKLSAIESLAGVDILCSDKTGTLTQNRLSVQEPFVLNGTFLDMMLVAVMACSRSTKGMDAIDKAIFLYMKDFPDVIEALKGLKVSAFQPFDPVSKKVIATIVDRHGQETLCIKGAPKAVLDHVRKHSVVDEKTSELYDDKVSEFALRGLRSLGVARKTKDEWSVLGILSFYDPPRPDAADTIQKAKSLGLTIKMLTGDSTEIARETARLLGLGTKIYDSKALSSLDPLGDTFGRVRDTPIQNLIEEADGFAEVFPQHKYLVVEQLQKADHLVAMTGDGINDAPSLKIADTGIAVEGATAAARSAADIVFLKAGLGAIVDALIISRMVFQRMRAYIIYRIALSLHLEIYYATSIAILNDVINVELVAFLAIFSDIATLAIAYDHASFSLEPSVWNMKQIWIFSSVMGLILAGSTWILRGALFIQPGIIQDYGNKQEIVFLQIALTQSWVIFVARFVIPFTDVRFPSIQLIGAILIVDVIATCFTIFGWLSSTPTDILTVILIWIYSFCVTAVLFSVYFILSYLAARSSRHEKHLVRKSDIT